jgi:enoyl-CoA hydratase
VLSIERREGVALVTLQRPEKRNALSIELRLELADAFGRISDDAEVGCVVLTGAGPVFCAGMDVTEFGGDREHKRRLVESSTRAFEAVGRCLRPVVAAVNGPALAGGFALALLCDLRIASDRASFGSRSCHEAFRRVTRLPAPRFRPPWRRTYASPGGWWTPERRPGLG